MALPPKFKGHRLVFSDQVGSHPDSEPLHTVELYLDYVCPFSAKLFNTIFTTVAPALRARPALGPRVQMLFRPQVQPWHPSSTLAHEAGLAVLRRAPERFWAFSAALMGAQRVYFDEAVARETRNQTYRRLARLAAESTGLDEDGYYALLAVAEDGEGARNGGNAVTADLKVVVKMARLVGVHVSPTVVLDGVVAEEVSSGWSGEQWMEWLEKKIG